MVSEVRGINGPVTQISSALAKGAGWLKGRGDSLASGHV